MEPPLSKPLPKKQMLVPTKQTALKQPPKIKRRVQKKRRRETKSTSTLK